MHKIGPNFPDTDNAVSQDLHIGRPARCRQIL